MSATDWNGRKLKQAYWHKRQVSVADRLKNISGLCKAVVHGFILPFCFPKQRFHCYGPSQNDRNLKKFLKTLPSSALFLSVVK